MLAMLMHASSSSSPTTAVSSTSGLPYWSRTRTRPAPAGNNSILVATRGFRRRALCIRLVQHGDFSLRLLDGHARLQTRQHGEIVALQPESKGPSESLPAAPRTCAAPPR